MSAIIEIDESNGAGEVIEHNIDNSNMGSVDSAELVAVDNPIIPGANSYEKWQKFHVTDMGGSSKIDNFRIWRTLALGGAAIHLTNARESSYGGAETYAQPIVTNSIVAGQAMPTSEPSVVNLGIGGILAGELTAVGYSDYLVHQIQTNVVDVAGSISTMHYQYDETV